MTLEFIHGPADGLTTSGILHTEKPIPQFIFFDRHHKPQLQWQPTFAGYRLSGANHTTARYTFYGWHNPHYNIST